MSVCGWGGGVRVGVWEGMVCVGVRACVCVGGGVCAIVGLGRCDLAGPNTLYSVPHHAHYGL